MWIGGLSLWTRLWAHKAQQSINDLVGGHISRDDQIKPSSGHKGMSAPNSIAALTVLSKNDTTSVLWLNMIKVPQTASTAAFAGDHSGWRVIEAIRVPS